MGRSGLRTWEQDTVECTSTTVAKKIVELAGGETTIITSLASNNNFHYIGTKHQCELSRGFKLRGGQSMDITLSEKFGIENYIEIWALPTNANDQVTYAKISDFAKIQEGEA